MLLRLGYASRFAPFRLLLGRPLRIPLCDCLQPVLLDAGRVLLRLGDAGVFAPL